MNRYRSGSDTQYLKLPGATLERVPPTDPCPVEGQLCTTPFGTPARHGGINFKEGCLIISKIAVLGIRIQSLIPVRWRGSSVRHRSRLLHAMGLNFQNSSVRDPDPEPDPHVFGPPWSGSITQRYGSDPHQNVTDPQQWKIDNLLTRFLFQFSPIENI